MKHARKDAGGRDERVARRQIRVDAGERAEPFRNPQHVRRQARYVARAVAILRSLLEKEPVLDQWAARLDPRRPPSDLSNGDGRAPIGAERRIDVVDPHLPLVACAPRLNDDQSRREPAVLDLVRVRQNRDGINRIVGQQQLRETRRRIDQRARAELQAGLTRTSALDADAARHFDDAGQQAQRGLQAAARRKLIELPSADRVALGEGPFGSLQHVGRHHVDGLRDAGDRQIERQSCRFSRGDLRLGVALVESCQRRRDPVFSGRQIGNAEVTVLPAEHLRDLSVGRVLDSHRGARQTDFACLRGDDPLELAGARLREHYRLTTGRQSCAGEQKDADSKKNDWSHVLWNFTNRK